MTDTDRIARLTELARKAWPDLLDVEVEQTAAGDALVNAEGCTELLADISHHPRALDALEAALCVLAGEPPTWVLEMVERFSQAAALNPYTAKFYSLLADELRAAAKGQVSP